MLDRSSLDVISRFKLAVLTRAQEGPRPVSLPRSNRGQKLEAEKAGTALVPKVVDYDGRNHLVHSNAAIERGTARAKRRWAGDPANDSDSESSDSESIKRMRLTEVLAPLSHPLEVLSHPAISKTFKLPCLATLAADLIQLIESEQNTLNHLNKLLAILDGEDAFYLLEENMGLKDDFFAVPEALKRHENTEPDADVVSYLQVSVQRQHEYIKNLTTIRNAVVKTDRYRANLLRWGKEMEW